MVAYKLSLIEIYKTLWSSMYNGQVMLNHVFH